VNISDELLNHVLSIEVSPPVLKTALAILALSPDPSNLVFITETDLAAIIDGSPKTVSRHLAEALSAGLLVERYRDADGACFGPPDAD
jgi:DNA-binding transcriptional ArsR family regulator